MTRDRDTGSRQESRGRINKRVAWLAGVREEIPWQIIDGYPWRIDRVIGTNVRRDKVKRRRRLIGASDAFLALSMMLR